MIKLRTALFALVAAASGPAFAESPQDQSDKSASCPMDLQGTNVRVEDTRNGVALTFTTGDKGSIDQLRDHVRQFSEQLTQARTSSSTETQERQRDRTSADTLEGESRRSDEQNAQRQMMEQLRNVRGSTTVGDVTNGARLEITPASNTEVNLLRARAHMIAAHLHMGSCPPMLSGSLGAGS